MNQSSNFLEISLDTIFKPALLIRVEIDIAFLPPLKY